MYRQLHLNKNGKNRPSKAGTFTLKCAEIETWSQDIWVWVWTFVFSWLQSLTFLPRFAKRHVRLLVNQRQIAACDYQRPAWCVISKVSEQEGPVTNFLNYEHQKLWHLSGYGFLSIWKVVFWDKMTHFHMMLVLSYSCCIRPVSGWHCVTDPGVNCQKSWNLVWSSWHQ